MTPSPRHACLLLGLGIAGLLAGCDNIDPRHDGQVPAPTIRLTASPTTLPLGASTTLRWTSADAGICRAAGAWSGLQTTAGSASQTPAAAGDAVYTLRCSGPGGESSASVTVSVATAEAMVRLDIDGRAVSAGGPEGDGGIAGAAIRVEVGSASFIATADAGGRFSVPVTVPETALDRLVRIIATGGAARPALAYASQLGSLRTLRAQASGDLRLTADENFRVNVSNVATAESALLAEVVGQQDAAAGASRRPPAGPEAPVAASLPGSEAVLAEALTAIDPDELLDIAVSLSLVADRGLPLPAGIADTLALALDKPARQQFIAELRAGAQASAVDEALARLLDNPAAILGATVDRVPGLAVSAITGAATEESLIGDTVVGAPGVHRFDADGGGRYADHEFAAESLRWSIDDRGAIALAFPTPPERQGVFRVPNLEFPGSEQPAECRQVLLSVSLQPISTTAARRLRTVDQTCPAAPQGDRRIIEERTVTFVAVTALPPITETELVGRTLGLQVADEALTLDGEALSFAADGSGRFRLGDRRFTWSITGDGGLQVDFGNGVSALYRRLRTVFAGGDLFHAEYLAGSGRRAAQAAAYFAGEAPAFTATGVPGTLYPLGIGEVHADVTVDFLRPASNAEAAMVKGLGFEIFGSGVWDIQIDRLATDDAGDVVRVTRPMRDFDNGRYWQLLPAGELVLRRMERVDRSSPAGCGFEPADPTCFLAEETRIEPFFVAGDRQGVLRRLTFRNASGAITGQTTRPEFFVQRPNGDYRLPR